MTLDLFDQPVLPGLSTQADLIDETEERMLIDRIDATDLTPFRFQGWTSRSAHLRPRPRHLARRARHHAVPA